MTPTSRPVQVYQATSITSRQSGTLSWTHRGARNQSRCTARSRRRGTAPRCGHDDHARKGAASRVDPLGRPKRERIGAKQVPDRGWRWSLWLWAARASSNTPPAPLSPAILRGSSTAWMRSPARRASPSDCTRGRRIDGRREDGPSRACRASVAVCSTLATVTVVLVRGRHRGSSCARREVRCRRGQHDSDPRRLAIPALLAFETSAILKARANGPRAEVRNEQTGRYA